ncbi:MAG: Slx4p interacting protein [Geoglossum simile]|nr:MAG: Slx4p interacting protein [Geoglossum simile]
MRISPKSGRSRHRPPKPRVCLTDRLGNLHLLLRVQSFARWPLEVRFFSEEVHRVWRRWTEREVETLGDRIKVVLDLKREITGEEEADASTTPPSSQMPKPGVGRDKLRNGGVEGLDVGFGPLEGHVEKSAKALVEDKPLQCAVCHGRIGSPQDLVATCPTEDCTAASHLTCLSRHFLACEGEKGLLLPTQGTCPECFTHSRWVDIAKELTLRIRGKKELEKLLKKARIGKSGGRKKDSTVSAAIDGEDESNETNDSAVDDDRGDEAAGLRTTTGVVSDALFYHPGYPSCYDYIDDVDDDVMSVTSAASEGNPGYEPRRSATGKWKGAERRGLDVVIEDSDDDDWDNAEVLD